MSAVLNHTRAGGVDAHCEGVVHIYRLPDSEVVALRGVDLDVEAGEAVALLGPSGSGKTTILSLFAGLHRPSAGVVTVGGRDLTRMSPRQLLALRSEEVGLVLQSADRNLLPYATAADNISFAQRGRHRPEPGFEPDRLLQLLGLATLARQRVATMSGGERQRVALAAGVASARRLLLVDEPTSELDPASRDQVIEMLQTLNRELGVTLLLVTHDPNVAAAMRRTVTVRDGRVGSEGRRGEEFAVVGRDGSIQLPPDVLEILPPGTLVRLRRHADGVDLQRRDAQA